MYFRTSFTVPSLKHLAARFLHHREGTRPCSCTPDICCRSCIGCWRVSLKCWVGRSLNDRTVNFCSFSLRTPQTIQMRPTILVSLKCTGSHQRNGTSPVCIRCMVLEIQLFLIHALQKVVSPCFHELGPHKSRKNNCYITRSCNVEASYEHLYEMQRGS